MKIIAVGNMKGGVGKTTTAIIVADALSAIAGKRVLVLDLDPQANMSWALLGPHRFSSRGDDATMTRWVGRLAAGEADPITPTMSQVGLRKLRDTDQRASLTLAASNTELRFQEMLFEGPPHSDPASRLASQLQSALQSVQENFDFVVLDCSPALSALTRAGLSIADYVFAPTPANRLCYESLLTFERIGLRRLIRTNAPLHVIVTRYGASQGKHEQASILLLLRSEFDVLDPTFRELKEYMKALDPPQRGQHGTLRERYGARVDDLVKLVGSLDEKRILT